MAKLIEMLKVLETVNRNVMGMPLIIIVADEALTNSQKQDIINTENKGQNVIKFMKDRSLE